ncbi:MAG: LarC family nickel insertion protein, partial [Planctomycetota bacterium]|nr:LarC family nickel insertion protein [Planctomycetota bacterium]
MRIAYLDCSFGIRGDMLLGALIDAGAELDSIRRALTSLGPLSCSIETQQVQCRGISTCQVTLKNLTEPTNISLSDALRLLQNSAIPLAAQTLATRVLQTRVEAESRVHGLSVQSTTPGTPVAMAEAIGCAVAFTLLQLDDVYSTPVSVGSGKLRFPNDSFHLPTPITGELLRGMPIVPSGSEFESTDPMGASLLRNLAQKFGSLPAMTITSIGYGASGNNGSQPVILLRLLLGEREANPTTGDTVIVLETNIDDSSGETIAYALERLLAAGALDCFATPVQMKKGRPGTQITVISPPALKARLENILFTETSTLGVRVQSIERVTLPRAESTWESPWGPIRVKIAQLPNGLSRISPEFEDCRKIACRTGH